jgi:hypothetical protein
MIELERTLTSDSAFAPPSHILEGVPEAVVHQRQHGAPHTIYEELWHVAFWQRISLDWVDGIETPVPAHASEGFPTALQTKAEPWPELCGRFLREASKAALLTRDLEVLKRLIQCPSPPGVPVRTMTVHDQLESLAAHNAYHLGRIVLLRQMAGSWPPASGGFTW